MQSGMRPWGSGIAARCDGVVVRRQERSCQAVTTWSRPSCRAPWRYGGRPVRVSGHTSRSLRRCSFGRRDTPQEGEGPPALPAVSGLHGGGRCRLTCPVRGALCRKVMGGAGRQERPNLREHFAPARAQEAVGADFGEPLGEHMLELCGEAHYVARMTSGAILWSS